MPQIHKFIDSTWKWCHDESRIKILAISSQKVGRGKYVHAICINNGDADWINEEEDRLIMPGDNLTFGSNFFSLSLAHKYWGLEGE